MGYAPVPATNDTISRYAAFLASSLKFTSVKQYMNIIRLMHVEWGLGNPLENNFIVSSLLKGIRRSLGDTSRQKKTITPQILRAILLHLDLSNPLDANFWALCLLLFHTLLRKGSVLPNSHKFTDTTKYLCRSDINFHNWGMMVHVSNTKTIQFQERKLSIPLPRNNGSVLCPVQATFHAFSFVWRRIRFIISVIDRGRNHFDRGQILF